MIDECEVAILRQRINQKKHKLNNMIISGLERNEIIALSQELDLLIVEYCKLEIKTSSM